MRLAGVLLKLAYLLRGHRWLSWRFSGWLGLLIATSAVAAGFRSWPSVWPTVPLVVSLVGYFAFLIWAERQGYVRFLSDAGADLLEPEPNQPTPSPGELMPVRASGWFTVEGKEKYLVDVDADLSVAGSGERIVMGRVHPSRFLLLGRWPTGDLGWWYLFLRPEAISEVQVGFLCFGRRPTPSLRLTYDWDGETRQAFISSADPSVVRQIGRGLRHDMGNSAVGAELEALRPGSG